MFAVRTLDYHICPMAVPIPPAPVPVPHVGGPVTGPGVPNVLIGAMPATVVGDMALCTANPLPGPATFVKGSMTVMTSGRPQVRSAMDMTWHGGTVPMGCPTVTVGG